MAKIEATRYPWKWRDELDAWREASKAGTPRPKVNYMDRANEEVAAIQALRETSNKLPAGKIVGAVLAFPAGDGAAYYIVTKEKPLTLQWIPYMDAWHADPILLRGLNKSDVLGLLERDKRVAALFGGKKKATSR